MPNDVNITISAKDQGATKTIKGVYSEIGSLNRQIKQEDTEWQKLSLSIDKAKEPVRYYTEYTKHLETQMGHLAQKSTLLKSAINQSQTAKGEDTKQTEKLRSQLSALELQEAKVRSQIVKNTQAIEENTGGFKKQMLALKEHSMHAQMAMMTLSMSSAAAFATLTLGLKSTVAESNELKNSLIGLGSVAEGTGQGLDEAKEAAISLSEDGLMTVADAATSLKNLLMRGFSLPEAIEIMNRFKDSAAFGRQASLSFGQAIMGATEGLKNENSILVDNAGVTKNVSIMWKEYAAELGKGVQSLTQAEKRQAEYNGIMHETRFQVGDAAKLTETFAGQQAKAQAQTKLLKAEIGEALEPTLAGLLKSLLPVVEGIKSWVDENPQLASTITLATFALTGLVGLLSTIAFLLPGLAAGFSVLVGPIGWVSIAVGLLTAGFTYLVVRAAAARGEMEKQRQEAEKLNKQYLEDNQNIITLADQYENLTDKLSKTKKGSAEYKAISDQLNAVKQELKKIMPDVISQYDWEGNVLDINTGKLRENARAAKQAIEVRQAQMLGDAQRRLIDARNELSKYTAMKPQLEIAMAIQRVSPGTVDKELEQLKKEAEAAGADYTKVKDDIMAFNDALDQAAKGANDFSDSVSGTGKSAKNTSQKIDELKQATDRYDKALNVIQASYDITTAKASGMISPTEELILKQQMLTDKIDVQKNKMDALETEYVKLAKTKGKSSAEAQEFATKILEEQVALANLNKELGDTAEKLKTQSFARYIGNLDQALSKIQGTFDITTAKLYGMITPTQELQLKEETLNAEMAVHQQKLVGLQHEYDRLVETKGKTSKEAEEFAGKIKDEELAIANLGKSIRNVTDDIKAQFAAMDGIISKSEKVISDYRQSLADAQVDHDKKVKQANDDLAKSEKQLTDEYEQELASRTSALTDWVGLFDKVPQKAKVSGQELLKNLQGQVDSFEDWQELITKLAAKGIDEGLLAELKAMGPKASNELVALNDLTDEELSQYVDLWKEKNRLAREQAVNELAPLAAETSKKIDELKAANTNKLKELEDEWKKAIGRITDNTLVELSNLVTNSEKYGADFVTKLVAGIISKIPELDKAIGEVTSKMEALNQPKETTASTQSTLSEASTVISNVKNEAAPTLPEQAAKNLLPINQGILHYKQQVAEGKMTAADAGAKADALREYAASTGIPSNLILGNIPISEARDFVDRLPHFAKGGTIKSPVLISDLATGKPAGIAGEAGEEVIVPTSKYRNGSAPGQLVINLHFNQPVYGLSDFQRQIETIMKKSIGPILVQQLRREGVHAW